MSEAQRSDGETTDGWIPGMSLPSVSGRLSAPLRFAPNFQFFNLKDRDLFFLRSGILLPSGLQGQGIQELERKVTDGRGLLLKNCWWSASD